MVTSVQSVVDVFLSYSVADREAATVVAHALSGGGLRTSLSDPPEGANWQDAIWRSLAECDAFVMIVNLERPHASSTFVELGAAVAWHKPAFAVLASETHLPMPNYLRELPLFPLTRLDDLVFAIRRSVDSFTEKDRRSLIASYAHLGVPTDQLLQNPSAVEELAAEFAQHSSRRVSGERLVNELLRLRKSGNLPSLRPQKKVPV